MNIATGLVLAASIAAAGSASAPAAAMPMARSIVSPQAQIQDVAYRRHVVRRAGHPVYHRHYGYNPGPALFGAMAGVIGAGIAASQQPYYYGYGYPAGPYYGYGYPYW